MTDTPKHSRRKPFVTPELTFFGQMHRIVMQSYQPSADRFSGKGGIRTNKQGDFFPG